MTQILNTVIKDLDYQVFSENSSVKVDVSVFNTEYRVLQKMKRINAGFFRIEKCSYHSVMRELLTAANGVIAYDFPLGILLSHVQEYSNALEKPVIPMTIIAWRNLAGRISCSVERLFLKWDNFLSLEDNLVFNSYMEQSARIVVKLLQEHYYPLGVIGKGDYIKTLRKVFVEQFGYRLI